jgi:DNA-binding NarL/FixJ family response regulator
MNRMKARVLLVEHDRFVRQGIRAELQADGASVVAEAANASDAIAAIAEHRPDVVLLDFRLTDAAGPDVCAALLARQPDAAIIVLGRDIDEPSVQAAVAAGARGYLLRDSEDLNLPRAIERVLAGETVIDSRAAAAALASRGRISEHRLTGQELNVLRLAAEGLTNPEIGARLFLSRHTVKEYLSHAMRKLDATNRMDAVRKATALGLIEGVEPPDAVASEPAPRTLLYNESATPIRTSDIKVTPLKIDRLEPMPESPDERY